MIAKDEKELSKSIALLFVFLIAWLVQGNPALSFDCPEPGKARWLIKTSLPEKTQLKKARSIPLADLLSMGNPSGISKNDKRYETTLIPAFPNPLKLQEGDLVSTAGWLHLVSKEENDCDYHIQISQDPSDGNGCLIVEIPMDAEKFIDSPDLRKLCGSAREFVRNRLLKGQEPSPRGNIMQHPVYVGVTGQLFFDSAHVGDPPRGKKNMRAATLWEIHPVTEIKFAPHPGR